MRRTRIALGFGFAAVAVAVFIGSQLFAQGEAAAYVGSGKCKKCHLKVHKDWVKKGHSQSMGYMKPEHMEMECKVTKKKCLACHVTGYGQPKGWVSKEKTPELAEVGCEACHGPCETHVAMSKEDLNKAKEAGGDMKIKLADPAGCVFCHNPHVSFKELYGEAK